MIVRMTDVRIWVDDVREPPDGWLWTKTLDAAIAALRSPDVTDLSLDHDLGEDEDGVPIEATKIADWMRMTQTWPERVFIHSQNPVGAKNLMFALEADGPYKRRTPRSLVRIT